MARTPKVVEDRKEQIIDAAMRVFSQKGFVRATNKDIAREAGITPGLIYHYFESKEAVFRAIVEQRSPMRLFRSMPPEMLKMPPDVFLPLLVQRALGIVEDEKFVQFIRVFLPELTHNPDLSPLGLDVVQQALGLLAKYFAAQMESGQLRQADPELSAQQFLGCAISFVLRRQIFRDPTVLQYTHEQIAHIVVDTILCGLLPR